MRQLFLFYLSFYFNSVWFHVVCCNLSRPGENKKFVKSVLRSRAQRERRSPGKQNSTTNSLLVSRAGKAFIIRNYRSGVLTHFADSRAGTQPENRGAPEAPRGERDAANAL